MVSYKRQWNDEECHQATEASKEKLHTIWQFKVADLMNIWMSLTEPELALQHFVSFTWILHRNAHQTEITPNIFDIIYFLFWKSECAGKRFCLFFSLGKVRPPLRAGSPATASGGTQASNWTKRSRFAHSNEKVCVCVFVCVVISNRCHVQSARTLLFSAYCLILVRAHSISQWKIPDAIFKSLIHGVSKFILFGKTFSILFERFPAQIP